MNSPYVYNIDFAKIIRESGFIFDGRKTNVRIDWNEIRAIDIERLIVERDFRTIDNHLQEVLNCQLETEFDLRILDSGFVKLFRLAQLSVEYLLQCRRHMDITICSLKEDVKVAKEEKEYLKKQLNAKEDDIRKLQHKLRKRYRNGGHNKYDEVSEFLKGLVLTGSTNTTLSVGEQNVAALSKCLHCDKLFMNQFFLQAHVNRRHLNAIMHTVVDNNSNDHIQQESYRAMTEKLHQEIKEMRERLSIAEKRHFDELFNKLTKVNDDIQKEEIEPNEKNVSNDSKPGVSATNNNDLTKEMFEEWKKEEQDKYVKEIETLKNQLQESINQINENIKESAEKSDKDVNDEKLTIITEVLNKQQEEVKSLRDQLHEEVISKENEMSSRLDAQEKQWRSKLQSLEEQYGKIVNELKSNMMQQTNESQSIQQQYQTKIESLEKNLRSQLQSLEEQSQKLDNLNEANKALAEVAERYQNTTVQKEKNPLTAESQEILPPYEDTVDISTNTNIKEFIEQKKLKYPTNNLTKQKNNMIISNYSSDSSIENDDKNVSTTNIATSTPISIKRPFSAKKLFEKEESPSKTKPENQEVVKSALQDNKKRTVYRSSETSESDSDLPKPRIERNRSVKSHDEKTNSIEKVLAQRPHLSKAVKKDLQLMVKKRLQNVGVQPKSKGLPVEEFKKAIKSLQYKEELMSKQYHGYKKCRKNIIKRLDSKLKQLDMSERTSTSSNFDSNKSNSPFRVMSSLLTNVKNKAKNIVRSKENLRSENEKISPKKGKHAKIKKLEKTSSMPEKLSARSILAMLDSKEIKPVTNNNKMKESESSIESSDVSSNEDYINKKSGGTKIITTAISHVPSKSIENLLNSPIRKPSDIPLQNSSTSNKVHSPINKAEPTATDIVQTHSTGRFSKSNVLNNSLILDDSITLSESDADEGMDDLKSFPARKAVSEDNVSVKKSLVSPKGVLKSVASASSLTKKKVLFDLDANEMKSVEPSYSIDDDVTKIITDSSENNMQEKINDSNDTIILSTKQSPKIAEISKLVQHQLSHRDVKPPTGSIDTLFQTTVSPKNGSKMSNLEHPIPIPRTLNKSKMDSDLELSDWSIDEIINAK